MENSKQETKYCIWKTDFLKFILLYFDFNCVFVCVFLLVDIFCTFLIQHTRKLQENVCILNFPQIILFYPICFDSVVLYEESHWLRDVLTDFFRKYKTIFNAYAHTCFQESICESLLDRFFIGLESRWFRKFLFGLFTYLLNIHV